MELLNKFKSRLFTARIPDQEPTTPTQSDDPIPMEAEGSEEGQEKGKGEQGQEKGEGEQPEEGNKSETWQVTYGG